MKSLIKTILLIILVILLVVHTLVDRSSTVTTIAVIGDTPFGTLLLLLYLPNLVEHSPIPVKHPVLKVS